MFYRVILFFLLFQFFSITNSKAQNSELDIGVRLQKSVNLYYENGITAQYTNNSLYSKRLYFGLSYVTSRLGSAIGSNAIKQDNIFLSTTYFFRPDRIFQPFLRLNTGYFYSDLEEKFFDDLPNSSILLSPEAGVRLKTNSPLKVGASFGYNLITGDGRKGPGTLYPVFIQSSITWSIINNTDQNEK